MNSSEKLFQHKAGAAVVAARRGGALNVLDAMNHFFMLQNMAHLLHALEEKGKVLEV